MEMISLLPGMFDTKPKVVIPPRCVGSILCFFDSSGRFLRVYLFLFSFFTPFFLMYCCSCKGGFLFFSPSFSPFLFYSTSCFPFNSFFFFCLFFVDFDEGSCRACAS